MRSMFRAVVSLSLALVPALSFASLTDEFEAIKNSGKNFEIVGTVCEEVARTQLAREFQEPKFTVVTGIAYGDGQRTIGELDVIVFDNGNQHVVKIAEVKCWRNLSGGLNKARDQRRRFLDAIRSNKRLEFHSTDDHRAYGQQQFEGINDFISIAQKGAVSSGYDDELPYSLEDLMELRSTMIQCQSHGKCPRH